MLRFRFRQLLLEKENSLGRRIPLREVSEATGISTQVLSSLSSTDREIVTNTAFLEALIHYFGCRPCDLIILDPEAGPPPSCHVNDLYPNRRAGRNRS